MPISTTVGGLENIVLIRLAFHQVATTHTQKKCWPPENCLLHDWVGVQALECHSQWKSIQTSGEWRGEEGGEKKMMSLILLKTDPRPWRYCVRIFEPPQRRERDNRRRSLRKWIWHDCVFIAHRVKKGNSGKLQMVADFCNNSAKSLSSTSGKNLLLFVDFIVPPKQKALNHKGCVTILLTHRRFCVCQ